MPSSAATAPSDAGSVCHLLTRSTRIASEYAVYSQLAAAPDRTTTELAAELAVPLTTMSHWVRKLVARGHTERSTARGDRRAQLVRLTPAGLATTATARGHFGRAQEALLAHLPEGEAELRRVLNTAIDAVTAARRDLSDESAEQPHQDAASPA